MLPGHCSHKAHDRANLGLGGRRVLVSRKWTGTTLAVHRADRADRAVVVRAALEEAGIDPDDHDEFAVVGSDGRWTGAPSALTKDEWLIAPRARSCRSCKAAPVAVRPLVPGDDKASVDARAAAAREPCGCKEGAAALLLSVAVAVGWWLANRHGQIVLVRPAGVAFLLVALVTTATKFAAIEVARIRKGRAR
jgi:Replication initiator protein, pSAM2